MFTLVVFILGFGGNTFILIRWVQNVFSFESPNHQALANPCTSELPPAGSAINYLIPLMTVPKHHPPSSVFYKALDLESIDVLLLENIAFADLLFSLVLYLPMFLTLAGSGK